MIGPLDDVIIVALVPRFVARCIPSEVLFEGWPGEPSQFFAESSTSPKIVEVNIPIPPIPRPDSPTAKGALAYLSKYAAPWLIAHSHRTFHFGTALLTRTEIKPDPELLFVAAMLHDLALGTDFDIADTDFQQSSADLAHSYMLETGAIPERAQRVHDAIELHLELKSGNDPRPEVAGVHLGALVDVTGLRLNELSTDLVEQMLHDYPRHGMKTALRAAMESEAHRKPSSRIAALVREVNLLDLITAAPFDS